MLSLPLFESVLLLVALILLGVLLRVKGVLSEEHGPILARLVTEVTLPALIVSALVQAPLEWVYAELALAMFGAELMSLLLAWGFARMLRLGPAQMAAVILAAGFGSSSLLGCSGQPESQSGAASSARQMGRNGFPAKKASAPCPGTQTAPVRIAFEYPPRDEIPIEPVIKNRHLLRR